VNRTLLLGFVALGAVTGALSALLGTAEAAGDRPPVLAPAGAVLGTTDTLVVGGFARGGFTEALAELGRATSAGEREAVGRHLDDIFRDALGDAGLHGGGRLLLAYERTTLLDGTPRSVRVLAAEVAVAGAVHRAFAFNQDGAGGYFDLDGRSVHRGEWVQPLARARLSSPFGRGRLHPILGRVMPHQGTDYAAPHGTEVRAAASGVVTHADRRGGYGNLVEIHHPDGYATRYAHLSEVSVRDGATVSRGEVIGRVGMTGLATGPHLHFEVRRDGRPTDPEAVLARGGPGPRIGDDLAWRHDRSMLASLLDRAPTIVSRAADPGRHGG
jgi:murein DD-endopeptidase MepM/ murein hydrolase activator NlpD